MILLRPRPHAAIRRRHPRQPLLPRRPQVQVSLQQQPLGLPAPGNDLLLKPPMIQPGPCQASRPVSISPAALLNSANTSPAVCTAYPGIRAPSASWSLNTQEPNGKEPPAFSNTPDPHPGTRYRTRQRSRTHG